MKGTISYSAIIIKYLTQLGSRAVVFLCQEVGEGCISRPYLITYKTHHSSL